jgi:hypothetical protein
MGRTIAFTGVLTMAAVTCAFAQGQGDAKERAACRPHVMRFCKQSSKTITKMSSAYSTALKAIGSHQ